MFLWLMVISLASFLEFLIPHSELCTLHYSKSFPPPVARLPIR